MRLTVTYFLLLLAPFWREISCSNIVFYMGVGSRSHMSSFAPVAKALALKGHNVTIIAPFWSTASKEDLFETISPSLMTTLNEEHMASMNIFQERASGSSFLSIVLRVPEWGLRSCRDFVRSPEVQDFLSKKRRIDLLVLDAMGNECALGLASLHDAILVFFSTTSVYPTTASVFGLPSTALFRPSFILPRTVALGRFLCRAVTAVVDAVAILRVRHVVLPQMKQVWQESFGRDFQDFDEVQRNASLLLLNTHDVADTPSPYFSNVVQIGGSHIQPAKPLPKDLEALLSNNTDFIIFSLGSVVKPEQMSKSYFRSFTEAFKRLSPILVLSKWDLDQKRLEQLPPNVLTLKWLPQNDLLAHPKCRALITHGGKLSFLETIHHGVPILVIPFFGDQDFHANLAQNGGFGLYLEVSQITAQSVFQAVRTLVEEPKFRQEAVKRSRILRDQAQSPLDLAVCSIEYVIKHKGAPHLRSEVRDLMWFQYLMLDVWIAVISSLVFVIFVIALLIYWILRVVSERKIKNTSKRKRH